VLSVKSTIEVWTGLTGFTGYGNGRTRIDKKDHRQCHESPLDAWARILEFVYQKALTYELRKAGMIVECEKPILVYYNGVPEGEFSADMLVENAVILELKANQVLVPPTKFNW
jgi:hypothetical protein